MQQKKCDLKTYRAFLIANQNRYSGLELEKVTPVSGMAHDSVSRFLARGGFTPASLWNEVKPLLAESGGYLIGDDTLVEKPYSRKNELAKSYYSGNHHNLMVGIPLVNLLWSDGKKFLPVDYRVYRKEEDGKTKNDHFLDMLKRAKKRALSPDAVLMDSWYGSVENLKEIDGLGWRWMTNLKSNRQVSLAKGTYVPVSELPLTDKQVRKVWLKEYGDVLVTKLVATNGDVLYLATGDLTLTDYDQLTVHWSHRWEIEEFHRGLKQTTGIENCEARKSVSQLSHIFMALSAFVKLEKRRIKDGTSWVEQKAEISRFSTRSYLLANA